MRQTGADHPRRRRPLKFCMRGRAWEVVIHFKFHENRSRGLRAVEGRKSPSAIDFAHGLYCTTACTTVQAVIVADFARVGTSSTATDDVTN